MVTCPGAPLVGTGRIQTQPLGVGPLSITQSASVSNAYGLMLIVDKLRARIYYIPDISHIYHTWASLHTEEVGSTS